MRELSLCGFLRRIAIYRAKTLTSLFLFLRVKVVSVKVGDIFYTSWGYDQTNIDFVKVVALSPTGKTALCKMMSQKVTEYTTSLSENVVPDKEYGEVFRLKAKTYRDEPELVGTYPFCNGGTRLGYFWPWKQKPLHQSHWH